MFKISGKKVALPFLLSAALLAVGTTGCKVDKTQDGKMPQVTGSSAIPMIQMPKP